MQNLREAMYYKRIESSGVRCGLCPHHCIIHEGRKGICRSRRNIEGRLYAENYGRVAAIAMDPIEKKPLYHFYPGKYILSIGTLGCNFTCSFCQNYHIAHLESHTQEATSYSILSLCRQEEDCIGVAYTYNEPSIWYEFVLDTSKLICGEGFKNVLVTNGFIEEEPLMELMPYISAMNIDVKGYSENYYREICGGSLKFVKKTVERAVQSCHVEITTLIVPGKNDSEDEIGEMAKWLSSIKSSIPLHLTRYFPQYKLHEAPTPVETLRKLKKTAEEYLDYVYIGNVGVINNNTYCPKCGALLLERGHGIFFEHLSEEGICTKCGKKIDIIM